MTAWAMLGVEASGRNPLDLRQGGKTPLDFLSSHPATSTADLEKVILAVSGAGLNPRSFGGRDLVAALVGKRNASGSWGGFVDLTAFGVFALKAGGASSSQLGRSTQWLRSAQNPDGGWGFEPGSFSTPDSTGSALQAIALTGAGDAGRKGVAYLRRTQGSDGSFGGNSQGTAWAVQGLTAVGVNPARVGSGGTSAFEYLAARQVSDGHYRYSASSDQTPSLGHESGADGGRARGVPSGARAARLAARRPAGAGGWRIRWGHGRRCPWLVQRQRRNGARRRQRR